MNTHEDQKESRVFAMTELDERLRAPDGKVLTALVLERFSNLIKQLEDKKASGLSPEGFAATETLLKAVAMAAQTVLAFTKFHQRTADKDDSTTKGESLH